VKILLLKLGITILAWANALSQDMATYEGVFIDAISQSKSFCRAICFSVQSKVKIYSDTTTVTEKLNIEVPPSTNRI
jgi:methylphosphotriester-DNA--protein-cysteine methyltransferase